VKLGATHPEASSGSRRTPFNPLEWGFAGSPFPRHTRNALLPNFQISLAGFRPRLFLALASVVTMLPGAVLAKQVKGTTHCTLYYVFEAPGEESAKGSKVTVITTKGEKLRVRVSPPNLRKANLEGTVTSVDPKDGTRYVTNIVRVGVWKDLPEGWEGKGNHSNPLSYYRTVAADQKRHPYGSRIFAPSLVDESIHGWDHPHDGYLWVADTGGAIKGYMRFDVFVGREEVYEWVMELENQKGHWNVPVEVEKLPSPPSDYSPRTDSGLKKILAGLGLLTNTDPHTGSD
jgi:3D (Asp-Asp-Asp) domain-containing protein